MVYICGVLQYTYKIGNSANIFQFFGQFLSYGFTTLFICISLLGYLIYFKKSKKYVPETTFSEIEMEFDSNYETENPMTKFQGEINYLYGLLKKSVD